MSPGLSGVGRQSRGVQLTDRDDAGLVGPLDGLTQWRGQWRMSRLWCFGV